MKLHNNKYNKQSGMSSIVFVLLVGLAITASTVGVMHSVKNTQQINSASNAITHAQNGTWSGVAAFQKYLDTLDATALTELPAELDIDMEPQYGDLAARNITVNNEPDGSLRIIADIINVHAAAKSSYAVRTVYGLDTGGSDADAEPLPPILGFEDSLTIDGGIEFADAGLPAGIVVDGDVLIDGVNINPVDTISATGTVELGSNVEATNVFANDDVILNSNTVTNVKTQGTFTARGGSSVTNLWANGEVLINAAGRFENVNTLDSITVSMAGGGGHGTLNAGDKITTTVGPIDHLRAVGDIKMSQWSAIDTAISMGKITCVAPHWSNYNSIKANGVTTNCKSDDTVVSGASETVAVMDPVTSVAAVEYVVDVWEMKDQANYFIEWDSVVNRIKVTVNNVNNLPDGSEYYLGSYDAQGKTPPHLDYLCESVNDSGNCTLPSTPTLPLCFGTSLSTRCISYDTGTNAWHLDPSQTAPGVLLFDGDIKLENGEAVSTILASGDISTAGGLVVASANYAGYNRVCLADGDHVYSKSKSRYVYTYAEYYPTNLCDKSQATYMPSTLGNVGLAAGGFHPDDADNVFSGGNIDLDASTEISGAVLAGNVLTTQGSVRIKGMVVAAGGAEGLDGLNSLSGNTVIDLNTSGDYDPFDLPDISAANGPDSLDTEVGARVLWVRTL